MNAAQETVEDQIDETSMETRIGILEADVKHIKRDVQSLHGKMNAANAGISALEKQVAVISATMATKEDLSKLEGALRTRISEGEGTLNVRVSEVEGTLNTRISEVEGTLNARISEVEGTLSTRISELEGKLNAGISELKGIIVASAKATENAMMKWFVATALATAALVLGLGKILNTSPGSLAVGAHSAMPADLRSDGTQGQGRERGETVSSRMARDQDQLIEPTGNRSVGRGATHKGDVE